jgi:hypothetical protein
MANLRADNLTGTGGRNAIDGSLYFQGYVDGSASDYLKIPDSDDLDMGTGDFTFECWTQAVEHTGNGDRAMGIFSSGAFTAGGLLIQNKNNGPLRVVIPLAAGGNFDESGSTNLWYGHWHHIAVVKTSNTIKAFVNGIQEISATHSVGVDFAHGGYATVAENCHVTYPGDYPFRGYISNLRLIKGTALYTANFTPPTQKLTAVENTVLLCCQDSDNALQEATGKTITGYGRYANTDTELVTNHSFNNGTTGWTLSDANEGSMAVVNGSLVLTNDDTNDPPVYAWQAVTTVVGQTYDLKVHFSGGTNSPGTNLAIYLNTSSSFGSSAGGSMTADSVSGNGIKIHRFKATVATTYLLLRVNANAAGTSIFSAASIKASDTGKAPKVLPPVGVDEGVVFDGDPKFNTQGVMYFPTGDTSQRGRGRGLFMGGYAPSQYRTEIDYIQIQSQGNAIDFGVLSGTGLGEGADCASSTRAIQGGGSLVNTMEYVTIATTSNTTDFGDLTVARRSLQSLSNETRGTWAGGTTNPAMSDVIDYVTIASAGNATDFGNLTVGRRNLAQAASSTRGVWAGGNPGSGPLVDDTIDYITIASAGNATDFGNLSAAYREMSGCSNGTRGVFGGGSPGPTQINTMEYITIATAGNVTDFGDLFYAQGNGGGTSNGTRGIFAGGSGAAYTNVIQYVTIATTGNAADFGDLTVARILYSATSDSHGGLS